MTREEEKAAKLRARSQREADVKAKAKKATASPMRSLDELRDALKKKASVGQLVSMMDSNNNDRINCDEFKEGIFMCGMRPVPTDAEITALFRSFDIGRDGALSYQEMIWALESDANRAQMTKPLTREEEKEARRVAKADREAQCRLEAKKPEAEALRSVPELRALLRKKATAGQLMAMMDENKNDQLNFDEFKQGLLMCGIRPAMVDGEMTALFSSFDVNRGGSINYKELLYSLDHEQGGEKAELVPRKRQQETKASAPVKGTARGTRQAGPAASSLNRRGEGGEENTGKAGAKPAAQKPQGRSKPRESPSKSPEKPPGGRKGQDRERSKRIPRKSVSLAKEGVTAEQLDGRQKLVAQLRTQLQKRHIAAGKLFTMMDDAKDDKISIIEFEKGIFSLGMKVEKDEIEALFHSFDIDSSGFISYEEMLWALSTDARRKHLDKPMTKEEQLAAEEEKASKREENKLKRGSTLGRGPVRPLAHLRFELGKQSNATAGHLFSMMDSDRDDIIGFDEFKRGIAMSGMRPVPSEAEMKTLFGSFDVDSNSVVSYQEMLWALELDEKRRVKMSKPMNRQESKAVKDAANLERKKPKVAIKTEVAPSRPLVVLRRELSKCVNVTTGGLMSMSDGDRDDCITFDEFSRGIAMAGMRPVPSEEEMQSLFASFDVDGDGSISHFEMCHALETDEKRRAKMGKPMNRQEAQAAKAEAVAEHKKPKVAIRDEPAAPARPLGVLRKELSKLSNANSAQLFMMSDSDKDNQITYEEFSRGIAMAGLRPVPSEVEMRLLFESFDVNENNCISHGELRYALEKDPRKKAAMGRPPNKEESRVQHQAELAERNKPPEQQPELEKTTRTVVSMRAELNKIHQDNHLFPLMDENIDDAVTFEEFKTGIAMAGMRPVPSEAEFRALFRSFDANADNVISHQEMIKGLEKDAVRKAKKAK